MSGCIIIAIVSNLSEGIYRCLDPVIFVVGLMTGAMSERVVGVASSCYCL